MLFGKKFTDKEFMVAIHEGTFLAGASNLGDFIPFIAFLDLQGLGRRAKAVIKIFDELLDVIIEERLEYKKQNRTEKGEFFVDVMLDVIRSREKEHQIDRSSIKAVILVSKTLKLHSYALIRPGN
ncbi:hypothetical protein Csa_011393 [Cucumis sativus]|uniref:Cytochrome P450 n=1 Tax=Cucumis sativus TaxID=3659 RepID=A0A0A0L7J4_CUCSA|nr:hypothetical protein Csa_011393 [Cucumis sativus]